VFRRLKGRPHEKYKFHQNYVIHHAKLFTHIMFHTKHSFTHQTQQHIMSPRSSRPIAKVMDNIPYTNSIPININFALIVFSYFEWFINRRSSVKYLNLFNDYFASPRTIDKITSDKYYWFPGLFIQIHEQNIFLHTLERYTYIISYLLIN